MTDFAPSRALGMRSMPHSLTAHCGSPVTKPDFRHNCAALRHAGHGARAPARQARALRQGPPERRTVPPTPSRGKIAVVKAARLEKMRQARATMAPKKIL